VLGIKNFFKKWRSRKCIKRRREVIQRARIRIQRESDVCFGRYGKLQTQSAKCRVTLNAIDRHKETVIAELEKPNPNPKKIIAAEVMLTEALADFEGLLANWQKFYKSATKHWADRIPDKQKFREDVEFQIQTFRKLITLTKSDLGWIRSVKHDLGLK